MAFKIPKQKEKERKSDIYKVTSHGEKVLAIGQADDLISDTGKIRVWRSRINDSISVEELKDGKWQIIK